MVEAVGCDSPSAGTTVLECLQSVPAPLLAAVFYDPYGVVDGQLGAEEPYLAEAPEDVLASGRFTKVPVMLGSNTGEALIFMVDILTDPEGRLEEIDQDWDEFWGPYYTFDVVRGEVIGNFIKLNFQDKNLIFHPFQEPTEEQSDVSSAGKDFYFAPDGSIEGPDDLPQFVKFHTDTHFT